MKVSILTVGKTRSLEINSQILNFYKRVKKFQIQFIEVKAYADDIRKEQNEIETKLKDISTNAKVILLTEWGKTYSSKEFSQLLFKSYENSQDVVFVIGGASGFSSDYLKQYQNQVSLSPMTFPHEIAKLLLMEQIYRCQAILDNHPYHK